MLFLLPQTHPKQEGSLPSRKEGAWERRIRVKWRGGQGKGFSFVLPHLKGHWGPVGEPAPKASAQDLEVPVSRSHSSLGSATGECEQREGKRKGGRGMKGRERCVMQRQGKAEAVGAAVLGTGQAAAPVEASEGIEQSCSEGLFFFFKREQLFPCGDETEKRSRGTRRCFCPAPLQEISLLAKVGGSCVCSWEMLLVSFEGSCPWPRRAAPLPHQHRHLSRMPPMSPKGTSTPVPQGPGAACQARGVCRVGRGMQTQTPFGKHSSDLPLSRAPAVALKGH